MRDTPVLSRRDLAALRRRYPLPDNVPEAELNLTQVAQFMGVSQVTVSNWLAAGMPYRQKGGNGREYCFSAGDVYAWRKSREADEDARGRRAHEAIQAMRLELIGGGLVGELDALSPKDKREVIQTQIAHEQFQRERNELLKRDDVIDAFEVIFSMIRDLLESLPDQIHREAGLTNKQIDIAAGICDRGLAETKTRIERFFADRPRRQKSRDRLFDFN